MSAAEQFNPYGLHAIRIPLGMLAYPGLTWGAKVFYGRAALYLGKPRPGAHCDAGLDTLAREMGTSVDTIDRWLKELTSEKFIERKRRGRLAAEIVFLQHPCLSNSASMRNQEAAPIPQPCGVEEDSNSASVPLQFRNPAVSIPQNGAFFGSVSLYENIHENIHKDIHSSSAVPAAVNPVPTDDETYFSSEKKKERSSSLARKIYVNGKGENLPETENLTPDEKAALVEDSRDALRASIASVKSASEGITQAEALKATTAPDREITLDILEAFHALATDAGQDDFTAWLNGTEDRALALKARDPGAVFALYRSDARKRAPDIAAERAKEQKRLADESIAEERRAAEERARAEFMATAANPGAAIAAVESGGGNIAEVLKRRLVRLGQPITPAEVVTMARKYRGCETCSNRGMIGSALDKTRQFCDCMEGEELRHEDPERAAREIEHAHLNVKNRLVAAAQTVSVYMADALESSTVTETPSELIFDAPKGYRLYFKDPCFDRVLTAAGEQRTIRLKWQAAA